MSIDKLKAEICQKLVFPKSMATILHQPLGCVSSMKSKGSLSLRVNVTFSHQGQCRLLGIVPSKQMQFCFEENNSNCYSNTRLPQTGLNYHPSLHQSTVAVSIHSFIKLHVLKALRQILSSVQWVKEIEKSVCIFSDVYNCIF